MIRQESIHFFLSAFLESRNSFIFFMYSCLMRIRSSPSGIPGLIPFRIRSRCTLYWSVSSKIVTSVSNEIVQTTFICQQKYYPKIFADFTILQVHFTFCVIEVIRIQTFVEQLPLLLNNFIGIKENTLRGAIVRGTN